MRIVFMGTPDFAVPSLKTLLHSRHKVVGVVTATDKPAGRGKKLRASAVKQVAREHGLPVLQPERFKDEKFLADLAQLQADLFVIVAFRILPEVVFTMPPRGSFNLHASLLPKYRGAAPINWALINGEKETGVTTFMLDKQVDTGNILLQRAVPISENMTAGELHDLLAEVGATLVLETINGLESGELKPVPQVGEPTSAPKLTPELERLDWQKDAVSLHNLIRGLSPFPGSYCLFRGKRLKILATALSHEADQQVPAGTVLRVEKHGDLFVQTGRGVLAVSTVKPEGKRAMSAEEFARGTRIETGERFE